MLNVETKLEKLTKHIEKMMQPYREIAKLTEPMSQIINQLSEQTNSLQKAMKPTLEIQKSLTEPLKNLQLSFENINKIYGAMPKFENPILENLDTFKEIGKRLKEHAEKTPEYFLLIARHGWFIDLECHMNFPSTIAHNFKENKNNKANELLAEYYNENLNEIFERLIIRHHNREKILIQIKDSFERRDYNLLIPCVLTQVDGICFDFTKRKFFIKEKKNNFLPEVTSELEKSVESFLELYLSPLQNQTPIMAREKDVSKFPCSLNRHEILHGISTDYGSELNSLKVISLLKYVSDLLTDLDNKALSTKHNNVYNS